MKSKEERIKEAHDTCAWETQALLYEFGRKYAEAYEFRDIKIEAIEKAGE